MAEGWKGKYEVIKTPRQIVSAMKKREGIATLATFDSEGVPNIVHLDFIYPKQDDGFLMLINKDSQEYHNLILQKKAMINLMYAGNLVFSILCRTGVVYAPLKAHALMYVVKADILEMKSDRSIHMRVVQGAQVDYRDEDAENVGEDCMDELRVLAKML